MAHLTEFRLGVKNKQWLEDWKIAHSYFKDVFNLFLNMVDEELLGDKLLNEKLQLSKKI